MGGEHHFLATSKQIIKTLTIGYISFGEVVVAEVGADYLYFGC